MKTMYRRLKKAIFFQRQRLLAAVLLPAFLLGTLPQTACICADGHREVFCPATRQPARFQAIAKDRSSRSCCQNKEHQARTCCRGKSGKSCDAQDGFAAKTSSCCHPVIEQAPPAVAAKKSLDADQHALVASVAWPSSLISALDLWPAILSPLQSPPPQDALIIFSRLTI